VAVLDSRNQQKMRYTLSDMDEVILQPARTSGGRYGRGNWYAQLKITFKDGEHFSFSVRSFADKWTESIHIAQSLKDIYGPLLHIEDTENLWKVVRDNGMTAAEEELLYWLFELEQ